ncbi:MAG: ATP-dependent Clp protease adaptor ClpS [Cytophagales bacterium]|nr:ATP-dependent Clp protease adaptor ClpS [Cytophagales bacterium]
MGKEQLDVLREPAKVRGVLYALLIYNDEVNTFNHVINTLVRVCKHTLEQAEQCAYIAHNKGKCVVKEGALEELKPMCAEICAEGINASIVGD